MRQATIRDVAREAAVSVASVSRVLNGHDNVRPELRARVQEVAARLAYVPHAGARNLSLARANTVGVVLPDLHGEFFSEILRGMDREASARGLQLLLSNIHPGGQGAGGDGAIAAIRTMRGRVDGMVVMAPHVAPRHLLAHLPADLPVVLLNCTDPAGARPALLVDNEGGARLAVEHLIATGRRRIVHVAGATGNVEAMAREAGYRAALAAHGGLVPRVIPGDFREASGAAAAQELMRDPDGVDAVFAANDMMAVGLLVTLRRAGVDVPGRIAVAGFDDIPLARLVTPALTTIRFGVERVGARAVARLADLVAGEGEEGAERCPPELVIRETTEPTIITNPINGSGRGERP